MGCDECGFVYGAVSSDQVPDRLRAFEPHFRAVLVGVEPRIIRRRPAPDVFSALEYTCHLRDVIRLEEWRIRVMLAHDEPEFVAVQPGGGTVTEGYQRQELTAVLDELAAAADSLAELYAGLSDADRGRTAIYHRPERMIRTLDRAALDAVHEGEHHLVDVRRAIGG
jgi:hypothetical protein